MINNVVAIVVTIAVVTGLFGAALYVSFKVVSHRFNDAAAKDAARWDARFEELQPYGYRG